MTDIVGVSAGQTKEEAYRIISELLEERGQTIDGIVGLVSQAEENYPQAVPRLEQAARDNNIDPDKFVSMSELTQTQLNGVVSIVGEELHKAKEAVIAENPDLHGDELADEITAKTKEALENNTRFTNAAGYLNDLEELAAPLQRREANPVTLDEIIGSPGEDASIHGLVTDLIPDASDARDVTTEIETQADNETERDNDDKPASQRDFDHRDATAIADDLPSDLFQNSAQLEAAHSLISRGIKHKQPLPPDSGNKEGFAKFGDQLMRGWSDHVQPWFGAIIQNLGGLIMGVVAFFGAVFEGEGLQGGIEAFQEKFGAMTQKKSTGNQANMVLGNIMVATADQLEFESPSGFTHYDLKRISAANDSKDQERIDQLNEEHLEKFGMTSREMWDEFTQYKTDLIYATADSMSRQARANGWPNMPDGNALVLSWVTEQPAAANRMPDGTVERLTPEELRAYFRRKETYREGDHMRDTPLPPRTREERDPPEVIVDTEETPTTRRTRNREQNTANDNRASDDDGLVKHDAPNPVDLDDYLEGLTRFDVQESKASETVAPQQVPKPVDLESVRQFDSR